MTCSLALLPGHTCTGLAPETTLNLLVRGDDTHWVGSIVRADHSVTTVAVAVNCAIHTALPDCDLDNGATIVQGVSTLEVTRVQPSWGSSEIGGGPLYV